MCILIFINISKSNTLLYIFLSIHFSLSLSLSFSLSLSLSLYMYIHIYIYISHLLRNPFSNARRVRKALNERRVRNLKRSTPSNLNQKSILDDFVNFWRQIPEKWLQERPQIPKVSPWMNLEGPSRVIENVPLPPPEPSPEPSFEREESEEGLQREESAEPEEVTSSSSVLRSSLELSDTQSL